MHSDDHERPEAPGGFDRAGLLRRVAAMGGAGLALPALTGIDSALGAAAGGSNGNYPSHPKWKFVFINHVTTNPFFVPTQYGDPGRLRPGQLLVPVDRSTRTPMWARWSARSNTAISANAAGTRRRRGRQERLRGPDQEGPGQGHPGRVLQRGRRRPAAPHNRMAYIGQDLYASGFAMGQRIVKLVPKGDVALFIATPGALNIQPRIDGAKAAIKESGKPVNSKAIATGADRSTTSCRRSTPTTMGHKANLKGMFAVDAGCTQGVGQVIQKYNARRGPRRRLRPAADHAGPDRQGLPATSRSTSSRTCRAGTRCCSCSCTSSRAA